MDIKHCTQCGTTHDLKKDCPDNAFDYFECSNCKIKNILPWDVIPMCGWSGMMCGCGEVAQHTWKSITAEEYKSTKETTDE